MHKIYDITNLQTLPDKSVSFALDTHILLWTFYSRCAITKAYQKTAYPEFIKKIISNGNKLVVTTLHLNEMLHFIEKNECDIYNNLKNTRLSLKKFRRLPEQRQLVQHEITLILKQLASIPGIDIHASTIRPTIIDTFTQTYLSHGCDFFDFYLMNLCEHDRLAVVSDDVDFIYNQNEVDLFTANTQILLKAANSAQTACHAGADGTPSA